MGEICMVVTGLFGGAVLLFVFCGGADCGGGGSDCGPLFTKII